MFATIALATLLATTPDAAAQACQALTDVPASTQVAWINRRSRRVPSGKVIEVVRVSDLRSWIRENGADETRLIQGLGMAPRKGALLRATNTRSPSLMCRRSGCAGRFPVRPMVPTAMASLSAETRMQATRPPQARLHGLRVHARHRCIEPWTRRVPHPMVGSKRVGILRDAMDRFIAGAVMRRRLLSRSGPMRRHAVWCVRRPSTCGPA